MVEAEISIAGIVATALAVMIWVIKQRYTLGKLGDLIFSILIRKLSKLGKIAHEAEVADFAKMISDLLDLDLLNGDVEVFRRIKADVLKELLALKPGYKVV